MLAVLAAIRLPLAVKFPLEAVIEQDQLWVPQQAQAITDKNRYNEAFSSVFRRNSLYFTTKPPGGNILTSSVLAEVRRFELLINQGLNATGYSDGGPEDGVYPSLDMAVTESGSAVTCG